MRDKTGALGVGASPGWQLSLPRGGAPDSRGPKHEGVGGAWAMEGLTAKEEQGSGNLAMLSLPLTPAATTGHEGDATRHARVLLEQADPLAGGLMVGSEVRQM